MLMLSFTEGHTRVPWLFRKQYGIEVNNCMRLQDPQAHELYIWCEEQKKTHGFCQTALVSLNLMWSLDHKLKSQWENIIRTKTNCIERTINGVKVSTTQSITNEDVYGRMGHKLKIKRFDNLCYRLFSTR
jgi:hypothetical protein